MLLERMGETVTFEPADGEPTEVPHVLVHEADISDQTVMDVQTRFINQARYKGDQRTLTVLWPKSAPRELMDAHVVIRGERYRVYGDPFPVAHSPNGYDTRLTVTRSLFLYDITLVRTVATRDEWGVMHEADEDVVETKANLLRLSEMAEQGARQTDLARVALFELPPDTWDERFTAFEYEGQRHHIESVDRAADVVVISGTREVT